MRTQLSAETWEGLAREGYSLESYCAMLQETVEDMCKQIAGCTVLDVACFGSEKDAYTVNGAEWLDLCGFPMYVGDDDNA